LKIENQINQVITESLLPIFDDDPEEIIEENDIILSLEDGYKLHHKIQSQHVSELTIIKQSYKETDEQYKIVVEALEKFAVNQLLLWPMNEKTSEEVKDFWKDNELDQELNRIDKKRKFVEKYLEMVQTDESSIDNKPYLLRKRRDIDYNEKQIIKKQYQNGYSTPSPCSSKLHSLPIDDSPFVVEEHEYGTIVTNDLKIGEINISQLFRKYQNESVKIAKPDGLFVELNVYEILALSSIFLLIPGSFSKQMVNIFGSPLLDEVYQKSNLATKSLLAELTNDQTLDESLDSVILECLKTLLTEKIKNEPSEILLITNYLDRMMRKIFHDPDKHIVEWPNTGLDKARQEISPPLEKNNVYKNCNDLIHVGIFMKDCLDSAIDLGADIKLLGFQCIDHTLDFYMMDLIQGTYTMIHIVKISVPVSIKEMLPFIDELEVLLGVQEIFRKSFNTFYAKVCNPSPPSTKASFKRDTLGTPKFKQL
ncbi:5435_t:CDS:2, partial [Gigaspora rosea]